MQYAEAVSILCSVLLLVLHFFHSLLFNVLQLYVLDELVGVVGVVHVVHRV